MRVFPGKTCAWLAGLTIATYLAGGTALYLNDRFRRDLIGISVWDRLYPPHWDRYQVARGDSLIRNGEAAANRGDLHSAAHLLRAGLTRNPAHVSGRVLLAEIYQFAKRDDLAEAVLLDGLTAQSLPASDDGFLRKIVSFLFQRQRDTVIIDLTDQLLSGSGLSESSRRYLALARANAFFYRGNFDQAESVLKTFDLQNTLEGRMLTGRVEWERGFPELSLTLIEQLAKEFPHHTEVYQLRIQWLAASGETDRARRISLLRRIDRPDELQPRIDLLNALHQTRDHEAVTAESAALLKHFEDQPAACLLLGDFAANAGRPDIADLTYALAERKGFPTSGLALMRVEARIVAGKNREAVDLSHRLLESNPDWKSSLAPVFNGLQAIAHFALGDRESADLYLNDFLHQKNLRAENLVAVSHRLLAAGAERQARRVLQQAVEIDPLNQPALTALVEFELRSADPANLGSLLGRLLEMRRPSPGLLRQAYETLGADRYIFLPDRELLIDRLTEYLTRPSRAAPYAP